MEATNICHPAHGECRPDIIASESRALSDGVLRIHHAFTQLAPLIHADRNCTMIISDVFSGERPNVLSGTMQGLASAEQIASVRRYTAADLRQDSVFAALFRVAQSLRAEPPGDRIKAVRRADVWSPSDMPPDCSFGALRESLCIQQSIYVIAVVQGAWGGGWSAGPDFAEHDKANTESGESPEFLLVVGLHSSSSIPEFSLEDVNKAETLGRLTVPFIIDHLGPPMPTPHAGEVEVRLAQLSSRQRELLPLLAQGLSEQEIADRLFRSKSTIHTHVRRIYEVLGVRNRVQLVRAVGSVGSAAPARTG